MEIQKVLYENYLASLGEEIIEVKEDKRVKVKEDQVRFLFITPPEFIYIAKTENNLSIIIPLTNYLQLAITDKYPPLITWRGYKLIPLPFWVYIDNRLLEKYSIPVFNIRKNQDKIKEYVKTARTKDIGEYRDKFIKKTAERYKDFQLSSLLALNS